MALLKMEAVSSFGKIDRSGIELFDHRLVESPAA
jgi:hypothetical protein